MKNSIKSLLVLGFFIFMLMCFFDIMPIDALFAAALPVGFSPLTWPAGSENGGGFKGRWLYIPASEVTATPVLPSLTAASEADDYVTAEGAFTFKTASNKPKYCYATDKSISYTFESQGEIDGKSFKQSCEAFFPGNRVDVAAFSRYVNNTPGYLILETKDGQQIMMGQPGFPVHITVSGDMGKALADKRGFTFKGESEHFAPMIVLGTPIDMDAIINPPAA